MKELFKITVLPEYVDECRELISSHTLHVREEEGNISSEAFQDIDDPCIFYRLVEFDSPENRKKHDESEADRAFVEKMKVRQTGKPFRFNWKDICG